MMKTNYTVKQIESKCEMAVRAHDATLSIPTHWHDHYELEIVTRGEYEHVWNGKRYTAGAGDAWIMTPLDCHSVRALGIAQIVNIRFSPEMLPEHIVSFLQRTPASRAVHLPSADQEGVLRQCTRLAEEMDRTDAVFRDAMVQGLLTVILVRVIRCISAGNESPETPLPHLMQSVSVYMHQNYKKDISLSEAAREHRVSVGYLGTQFRRTFGCSFHTYLNRLRLRNACDMLRSTFLTAKEVAGECGYNSTEYFFSVFRRYMGMTPAAYRESEAE